MNIGMKLCGAAYAVAFVSLAVAGMAEYTGWVCEDLRATTCAVAAVYAVFAAVAGSIWFCAKVGGQR